MTLTTHTRLAQSEQIVSQQDIEILARIRKNVSDFIAAAATQHDAKNKLLLDIAPQDHNDVSQFFTQCTTHTLDLNPAANPTYCADLCQNNANIISANSYDFVVCTEVLEHTLNPFLAVAELYRVLKPGGIAFVSTPFNFRIHGPLPDCWRFTEHGLRSLFSQFATVEIEPLEESERFLMPLHYTTTAQKK